MIFSNKFDLFCTTLFLYSSQIRVGENIGDHWKKFVLTFPEKDCPDFRIFLRHFFPVFLGVLGLLVVFEVNDGHIVDLIHEHPLHLITIMKKFNFIFKLRAKEATYLLKIKLLQIY